jgi:WD40 repeat protein
MTQADLSNVALKVGGTVLSGMKSLGEKAYSAALSRAGLAMESMSGQSVKGLLGPRGEDTGLARMAGVGRFFSRSAPAAANDHHERRYSTSSVTNPDSGHGQDHGASLTEIGSDDGARSVLDENTSDVVPPTPLATSTAAQAGHHVTVLDLEGLLRGRGTGKVTPRKVAEFVTKNRAISGIAFSDDGNSILVSPRDGQVCQVFQLRPNPVVPTAQEREVRAAVESDPSTKRDAPWHMYDLRRGRTNAVIEGVDWAEDGRWIAIGTRKRTIHVFAVNPYGGRPDQRSHIEGRVRNYTQLVSLLSLFHTFIVHDF